MDSDHPIGVQSVVFQHLGLEELLGELDRTGIDHLELWPHHLSPGDGEAAVEAGVAAIEASGVSVCGYGVVDLSAPGEAREHVEFADRLGAGYVTVNYPPDRDEITAELCDLADEFDVDVAIHNFSSVHHDDLSAVFSTAADAKAVLDRHDHPRLGVCVDTGHFLVMDQLPDEVIPAFGEDIVAVHLKDTSEAEVEDVPGAGRLDLGCVLELLGEHAALEAPLVIEYELTAERATEALREAEANLRAALEAPATGAHRKG